MTLALLQVLSKLLLQHSPLDLCCGVQEAADRVARRMWRPYPARKVAADVIERVLHTGPSLSFLVPVFACAKGSAIFFL